MSELRPRSNRSKKISGIARHGRLKKASPWAAAFTFLAATLAVALVSGASVAAIALNQIRTSIQDNAVDIGADLDGPPPSIGAIEGGFNILIVGSDTRAGQGGIGGTEKDAGGTLNDVNMLLHVSEDQTNATAISFPRDMVVPIPQCEREDGSGKKAFSTEPINVALYYGGLPCVVQTVEGLTGLPIQFAGMITFTGVIEMTNAVGGVPVCVTGKIADPYTGLYLEPGTHKLAGVDALAFLRSRHGVGDGSDLTRISSQQVYLSSLVRTLKSADTLSNPQKLYGLAQAASNNMTLSSGLANIDTMVSIALALKNVPLERVTFVQYPGKTGGTGIYAGKVQPIESAAKALMAKVASDTPFLLEAAGDGKGSEVDPNAPTTEPTPNPTKTEKPVDNTGLEVVKNVRGQTAADYTCTIAND